MTDAPTPRPSDRFIPWYIVLFFVAQTILFAWFVTIVEKTYTGVVTDQAYEKGLAYNSTIEKARVQDNLGLSSTVTRTGDKISFSLRDKGGQFIPGADVTLTLFRPVHAGVDVSMPMKEIKDAYVADVRPPEAGLWEVRILAKTPKGHYQTSERVVFE